MNTPFLIRIYFIASVLLLSLVFLARDLGIGLDDMFQYDMLGRSLAAGNGYRWYMQDDLKQLAPFVQFDLSTAAGYDPEYGLYTSFRAPLYPAFLAAVYYIFGTGSLPFFAARVIQAVLLGAPLASLTYLVSRSLFPRDEHPSRLAAIIVAFYPVLLLYPLGLGTEHPFIVLLLISMIFLLRSV